MTARLFTLHPVEGFRPKTFAGHKEAVVAAYFSSDSKTVRLTFSFVISVRLLSILSCIDLYRQS